MDKKRKVFSRKEKASFISGYSRSKMTQKEYAKKKGIALSTLQRWLKEEKEKRGKKILSKKSIKKEAKIKSTYTHEDVAKLAYEKFVKRGGAHGYHMEDWANAEKELKEKYK